MNDAEAYVMHVTFATEALKQSEAMMSAVQNPASAAHDRTYWLQAAIRWQSAARTNIDAMGRCVAAQMARAAVAKGRR
jgi:hypothetical protein